MNEGDIEIKHNKKVGFKILYFTTKSTINGVLKTCYLQIVCNPFANIWASTRFGSWLYSRACDWITA